MPTIRIDLPDSLQELAGGATHITAAGTTVGEALDDLGTRHETLLHRVLTRGGDLRQHVNLFLNNSDIRAASELGTTIREGDVLVVVPSVAGG